MPRRAIPPALALLAPALALTLAAGLGSGCRAGRPTPALDQPPPRPAQAGLEVRLAPVRNSDHAVARRLAAHETNPIPADALLMHRWREAGLRLIAVPESEVDELLGGLTPAGAADASTWAQMPLWHPLVAGEWGADRVVKTGEEVIEVAPGRARLLCRAWFEPALGASGAASSMRIELLPQIQRPRQRPGVSGLERPSDVSAGAGAEGPVLHQLALSLSSQPGMAYLIVGEDPALDWADLPDPPPPPPPPDDEAAAREQGPVPGQAGGVLEPAGQAVQSPGGPVGPVPTRLRTLGEALLSDPGSAVRTTPSSRGVAVRPPTKLLVVLRPRPG